MLVLLAALLAGQQTAGAVLPNVADEPAGPNLPVSIERIRTALEQPAGPIRKTSARRPDFIVYIRERRPGDLIIPMLDFGSGPIPAGGLYAYDQWKVQDTTYVPPQIGGVDVLQLVLGLVHHIADARHAAAERAAREEVRRALAEFCAVNGCSP